MGAKFAQIRYQKLRVDFSAAEKFKNMLFLAEFSYKSQMFTYQLSFLFMQHI